MNKKIVELLKNMGVDSDSDLGKELIKKYDDALKQKQDELKELEDKLLQMAQDDFLRSIK